MNYQTGRLGGIIEAWNAIRAWDSSKGKEREAAAAIAAPYEQARATMQAGAANVLDAQQHAQDRALLMQKIIRKIKGKRK